MTFSSVKLSGFALDVLDSMAPTPQWPAEETVERAIDGYLADRTLRPPGWACLPLPEEPRGDSAKPALEVPLTAAQGDGVAAEAAAQGVSPEALVIHAVMYLWAAEKQSDAEATRQPSAAERSERS
jgi:hypothetical protein